jgi:hypothetical protein
VTISATTTYDSIDPGKVRGLAEIAVFLEGGS